MWIDYNARMLSVEDEIFIKPLGSDFSYPLNTNLAMAKLRLSIMIPALEARLKNQDEA